MLAGYADCVALVSGCFVLIVLICDFILCFVCWCVCIGCYVF